MLIARVFSLLTLFVIASSASAGEIFIRAFGSSIQVVGRTGPQALKIDGRQVHSNVFVSVEEIGSVADVGVIIGTSSGGGNICDGSHFVISIPRGRAARFDGPLNACGTVLKSIGGDAIEFERPASPGIHGSTWRWTFADGFQPTGTLTHTASPSRGWPELRERQIAHPIELLSYGPIAGRIRAMTESDYPIFATIIGGPGSGEFRGDMYVGTTCAPHQCSIQEAITIADLTTRQVFLAYKLDGLPIVVRPKVAEWPPAARAALRNWARKWP